MSPTYPLFLLLVGLTACACGYPSTIHLRADDDPVVDVNEGRILGTQISEYGVDFFAFLSIPYAQPPNGTLRFKNPEPSEPWVGELNGTSLPHDCVQFFVGGREDCLYVNVYTPITALNATTPLPVLVWIHGGGFYMGGSSSSHDFQTFLRGDVVVAMIQYRLGVLGFMSTEDAAAPGNLGLKDQTLALQWIHDNIAAFGGDNTRVTIMGQSAGAASVHYQMLVPSAAGLFSGAIMQSGNAFGPWASGRNFLWAAQEIALHFECPTEPSDALVTCLQDANAHELDAMYVTFVEWNFQPFYFAPRVDGDYLPEEPAILAQEGRYYHAPTIMGIDREDMALESVELYFDPQLLENLAENFTSIGQISLQLHDDEDPLATATAVYDYYNGGTNFSTEHANNLTMLLTDRMFGIPQDWLAEVVAGQDPTYVYEMHHRGQNGYTNWFLENGLDLPQAANYIAHGDEMQYQFYPDFDDLQTPEDIAMRDIYITLWLNFIKTGNPTPDGSLGFTWEPTNAATGLSHLKMTPTPVMEADLRATDRLFWNDLPLRINGLLRP